MKTNGARLEISFPGVQLGVFAGRLQYTVYKGANLIRQEVVAKTDERAVAYKYDAGLKGLSLDKGSRAVWRDIANTWQDYQFGGTKNEREVPLSASNRLLMIERGAAGTIAAFPPPHTFFWAREVATNLGYVWYRKDSDASFSFGIRQAEKDPEFPQYAGNFALYSARPGTWQRMAVYFYASADAGRGDARSGAGVHARRSLQAAPGLPGDESPLPHGSRTPAARRRQPRRGNPRSPRPQVARHQHRQPGRLGRIPDAAGRARRRS